MKTSLCAVALLLVIAGFSYAADNADDQQKNAAVKVQQNDQGGVPQPGQPRDRMTLPARGRAPMNPEERREMYNQMMAQRGMNHQEIIRELEEIKKVAQEENATKTIAAIDALIERKNAEFQKTQAQEQKRREEFQKRMQERLQRQGQDMPAPEAGANENLTEQPKSDGQPVTEQPKGNRNKKK